MAEQRRVPFVSFSPIKPRESAGIFIAEQQQQWNLLIASSQRSQSARPQLPGTQQQSRLIQQTPAERPQREVAASKVTKEAAFCHPISRAEEKNPRAEGTVRLEVALLDPTDESCAEFSYRELLQNEQKRAGAENPVQVKLSESVDPLNDEEREQLEVEKLARKFEAKYGGKSNRHRKDRMQDLIDIGYGYDETDPFIDNSEAYDELVPASLTTKYGGFYINTGTLQFRQASDSESEDLIKIKKQKSSKVSTLKDDRSIKKRKRKDDLSEKEKSSQKLKVQKPMGVMAFNPHKPDKKKKKLYKDSLSLAAMIRKFQREKDAMQKNEVKQNPQCLTVGSPASKPNPAAVASDLSDLTLGSDPVLAIFGGSERELLQEAESALEMLGDIDFDKLLDSASNDSPSASDLGENGNDGLSTNQSNVKLPKQIPSLPEGLPAHLETRIEDLRAAAKTFDEEGRKKFFTQEMNNILFDIELQLQELSPSNRNDVYGYIEAFVPCSKETLMKRLKKRHLNIQDDRLKEPLQRLKLAISSVMPGQLNRYQEDCQAHQAKSAKHEGVERERNPSEEDDDEKPGKRVMGPRKKFYWDDTLRNLLCNLVKIKLGCYKLDPNKSQSVEDYLKNFMETEVKPLWPKGWMQSRMLFKESRSVHNHLTSVPTKKKVIVAQKQKVKESSPKKEQKSVTPLLTVTHTRSVNSVAHAGVQNASDCTSSETICLDNSIDECLSFKTPSLDSISEALSVLNGTTTPSNSHTEMPASRPRVTLREEKLASIMSRLPLSGSKKADPPQHTNSLIAGQSAPIPKKHQDIAPAHSTIVSGLIAGSSIQNPKVSLEPLPAKLLQQGMQRTLHSEVSSSSTPAKVKVSTASSATSTPLISSLHVHVSSSSSSLVLNSSSMQAIKIQTPLQQNYVTPLQATISKSHTNPVVRLTSSPQISSTSPVIKTPEKTVGYRPQLSPSSGSSQHTTVPRSAVSSTSTCIVAKNIGSQGSNPAFKSPYIMASLPQITASLSSFSSGNTISQNSAHHKVSSGINIAHPNPTSSPIPSGRALAGISGLKNPCASPKIQSSSPKLVTTAVRQTSPSPNLRASSPVHSSVTSPKKKSPSPKPSNASPKPVNPTQTGPIKTSHSTSTINIPMIRASQNASVLIRTPLSGATGSGAVGTTKPPISHRQPSSSGSPFVTATMQSAASLLANTSPLTLMASPLSVTNPNMTTTSLSPFGMLGGLVPVNMPFQFPLELLTFGSDTAGAATSSCSTSAAFHHNIAQRLQTTATHTATISHSNLPAHLQQAFTDGGQSQGDSKLLRKNP